MIEFSVKGYGSLTRSHEAGSMPACAHNVSSLAVAQAFNEFLSFDRFLSCGSSASTRETGRGSIIRRGRSSWPIRTSSPWVAVRHPLHFCMRLAQRLLGAHVSPLPQYASKRIYII
jgi:hypothetical protein